MQGPADWQQLLFIVGVMSVSAVAGFLSIKWVMSLVAKIEKDFSEKLTVLGAKLDTIDQKINTVTAQYESRLHQQALSFEQVIGAMRIANVTALTDTRHAAYTRLDTIKEELGERIDNLDERHREVEKASSNIDGLVEGLKVSVEMLRPFLASPVQQTKRN